jgi:hypothetical protein
MAETSTVDAVLARATGVEAMEHVGVSGAQLFRLQLDGEPHVLKYLDWDRDWTLRASGIPEGAVSRLWTEGVLDRLPACFNQPIVAVIPGPPTAVLMRDVRRWLVPNAHAPVPLEQHVRFLDHMAEMHVAFWNGGPEIDAVSAATRFAELGPAMGVREGRSGARVPALVGEGWPRLAELAPQAAEIVVPLADDPTPLVDALATTPQTFVHGNLRFENLGTDDAGRTVVIDWELPGRGAPLSDLAWYLAMNYRRLPHTKEETITAYGDALERRGIDTRPWWDRQLALSLLGGMVWFGWWKALERRSEERDWWVRAALEGAQYL